MPEYRLVQYRGLYAVAYTESGKRRRRSLGTADRATADARFVEFKRIVSLQDKNGPISIADIYAAYVQDREADRSPSTTRICDAWKRLSASFGSLLPAQITPQLCRQYTAGRQTTASKGTIHLELGYLRAAMRFAEKQGWIDRAPHIPLPSKPPPKTRYLTRDELRTLIEATRMPHMRLFVILAITTAGRAAAILDLTWDRVNLERRIIDLRDPARDATLKGRAVIPVNDLAMEALLEARQGAMSPYVVEWGGGKVTSVKKGIAAAARRAGLQCTPHMLRHSAAVLMAEAGTPMSEISQYLGHTSTAVTERTYARFSPHYLRRAAGALEL